MAIKNILDGTYMLMLIGNAFLYIPQARLIYKKKSSEGVSFITFIGFMFVQCLAIINGLYYDDSALYVGKIVSLVASSTVLWLILFYRQHKVKGLSCRES